MSRVTSLILAPAALLVASCEGDGRLACHPAAGRVTLDGQPVDGAEVWLIPVDDALKNRVPPVAPYGKTAADGTFTLHTYLAGDGGPAGAYQARVICEKKAKAAGPTDDDRPATRNVLPARYADPAKSGLPVTLVAGDNKLPDFALVSK